jgi:hypothetical protein
MSPSELLVPVGDRVRQEMGAGMPPSIVTDLAQGPTADEQADGSQGEGHVEKGGFLVDPVLEHVRLRESIILRNHVHKVKGMAVKGRMNIIIKR